MSIFSKKKSEAINNASEPETESGKMSFLEHLDELRRRLVHIAAYVAIGFAICCFYCKEIFNFICRPVMKALPPGTKLAFMKLTDPFSLYMKVSILAGLFLMLPFILYEVWKFIAPGLYLKEKKYIIPFLLSSMLLFGAGVTFCYTLVLPATFKVLIEIGSPMQPVINSTDYLDLANMMLLGFGLIFEMPVIIAFLSLFGLISAKFLLKHSRIAVIVIFIAAAVISPTGDALNLMVWATPMLMLFIISIGVAYFFDLRRRRQEKHRG